MFTDVSDLCQKISNFSGLTEDSRKVRKNYIFVAVKGKTTDGHAHIGDALERGASLVICEQKPNTFNGNFLKVDDSRVALSQVAAAFYGYPSRNLRIVGVTGTKGKTTTSHMIYHILQKTEGNTGLISTIVAKIGGKDFGTGFHVTSPDVITLNKFLREMVDAGCKYCVLEVSSHGIDQKRISGIDFEVGVVTNIAPEHLDYHGTYKEYKRVKMSFVNSAKNKVVMPKETDINIFPGKFNNLDAESAVNAVSFLGIDRKTSLEALESFELPEGRLQRVENSLGIDIFIDFAHTPDSLEAALTYFKSITSGRLISVFGCAGERDVKKRRKMGRISENISDYSIFTAEDPRRENLTDIFALMKKDAKNFICIPERGEAIAYALSYAKRGDTVVFLGKGHESSMAYKGFEHPWSDKEEINNFLSRDESVSAIVLAAGRGSRMKSSKPKILHEICGRPMISYSLQNLRRAGVGEIIAVVSYRKNLVINAIKGEVKTAFQKNPKGGTGDAARVGMSKVSEKAKSVMVLYGDDTAFYSPDTISKVIKNHHSNRAVITFITLTKENPYGLGRIVRNRNGDLVKIVEEKDANEEEKKISEVNDGLYVFDRNWFEENVTKINPSMVTRELYIVDLIKMAIEQNKKVTAYRLPTDIEWQGVNTPAELEKAKEKMEERLKVFSNG